MVVWIGYQTTTIQSHILVAVFGISSAVVAPIGIALITYAFKRPSEEDLIKRLAKVPDIERLIHETKNQEEKIRLLEKQKEQLADVVILETRRQMLTSRKDSLERDAIKTVEELEAIDSELASLKISIEANEHVAQAIAILNERIKARQSGDLIFTFGNTSFKLETAMFNLLPASELLSGITISFLRGVETIYIRIKQ